MRNLLLLTLFFVFSCAFAPERKIASIEVIAFGNINADHSLVQLFPNRIDHPDLDHFYLELRDSNKALVDVDLGDIALKVNKQIPSTYIRRISIGRYEVEVSDHISHFKNLKFVVQNKIIKHAIVNKQKPTKTYSSIIVISDNNYKMNLRLTLKDEKDSLVKVDAAPDIILNGDGNISMPQMVKSGIWEIEVSYPEMNQIMYFSIRANGVLLEKLLRYQHIEK